MNPGEVSLVIHVLTCRHSQESRSIHRTEKVQKSRSDDSESWAFVGRQSRVQHVRMTEKITEVRAAVTPRVFLYFLTTYSSSSPYELPRMAHSRTHQPSPARFSARLASPPFLHPSPVLLTLKTLLAAVKASVQLHLGGCPPRGG